MFSNYRLEVNENYQSQNGETYKIKERIFLNGLLNKQQFLTNFATRSNLTNENLSSNELYNRKYHTTRLRQGLSTL